MPSNRQDYLGTECELGGLTIPDFQGTFCVRCTQPTCTRSQAGKSSFDQRVQNWYPRLFDAPKLDAQDPRYSTIAAKRFLTLDVGKPAPGTSVWLDPRDGGDAPRSAVSPVPSAPTIVVAPLPPGPAPQAAPAPSSGMNTPFQGGVMIGTPPAPKPTADPWAVPEKPREPVVTPGSKIKLGGGSGV